MIRPNDVTNRMVRPFDLNERSTRAEVPTREEEAAAEETTLNGEPGEHAEKQNPEPVEGDTDEE